MGNTCKSFEEIKEYWTPEIVKDRDLCMYIDHPFCMSRCSFCDYSTNDCVVPANTDEFKNYYELLSLEIEKAKEILTKVNKPLDKLYMGGGTTTVMPIPTMEKIFKALPEVVLGEKKIECNPLLLSDAKIDLIIKYGFNSVSMGVQSLDEDVLKANNRKPIPIDRLEHIINRFKKAGIVVNLDLMAFIGDETLDDLIPLGKSLERLQMTNTDIITVYPKHSAFQYIQNSLNGEDMVKNQLSYIRGKALRKLVNNTTNVNTFDIYDSFDDETMNREDRFSTQRMAKYSIYNIRLIRKGLDRGNITPYVSSSPPHHEDFQAVIGVGGLEFKSVYSYIGRTGIVYYNLISNNRTGYMYNLEDRG